MNTYHYIKGNIITDMDIENFITRLFRNRYFGLNKIFNCENTSISKKNITVIFKPLVNLNI